MVVIVVDITTDTPAVVFDVLAVVIVHVVLIKVVFLFVDAIVEIVVVIAAVSVLVFGAVVQIIFVVMVDGVDVTNARCSWHVPVVRVIVLCNNEHNNNNMFKRFLRFILFCG